MSLINDAKVINYNHNKFYNIGPSGMYFKNIMIVNDDSSIISKKWVSLTDDPESSFTIVICLKHWAKWPVFYTYYDHK